jgi:hypothetical protein
MAKDTKEHKLLLILQPDNMKTKEDVQNKLKKSMADEAKTPELDNIFDNEWNFLFGIAGIREKLDESKKSYEFLFLHSL